MKGFKYFLFIVSFSLFLHAGGFALSGVGTRELSLGGAVRTSAAGFYSVYWNPALIDSSYSKVFQLSLSEAIPLVELSPNTGLLAYDGPYSQREKVYNKTRIFTVPSFGVTYSFKNINIAFGLFIPFGLGTSYDLYDYPVGFESDYDYPQYDWESDLKVIATFIGFSKSFGKLRTGLSFGPTYSSIMFRTVHLATVDSTLPVEYAQFPVDQKMEGSGWGFGGAFGLFYSFNEKLSVGFSFRGFTKNKLKGSVNLALYTPKNDYIKNHIKNDGDPANDADTLFFQGDKFESSGDVNADFPLPMNLGLGFKFSPSEKLSLLVDFDYTLWQLLDRVPLDLNGNDPKGDPLSDDTLVLDWENTFRVSLGIEYFLNELMVLRTGFYYDQSPIPEKTLDPLIPDAGDKFSFNLGSGFRFTKFSVDLNYEFVYSPKKSFTGLQDADNDGEFDNFPGEYSTVVHAFGIGINFRF
jgi:long-chain fatty acid transport protein